MLTLSHRHTRGASWAIAGLEAGAALSVLGLTLLYLNPFWRFDAAGFLDWRLYWWNTAGEILIGAGLLILALTLLGALARIVSLCVHLRIWPYVLAGFVFCSLLAWVIPSGFTRNFDVHFEWNAADGFNEFRLQTWDQAGATWHPAGNRILQAIVGLQVQPLLKSYFRVNDWQKMNGDIGVEVVRIIPAAWPVALGNGGETLDDPDETPLMRAAAQQDLATVQQLLSKATPVEVNALNQDQQTALILACKNPDANPDIVKALLQAGADANLRSRSGYTALTWAQARNNKEVMRLLRHAGGRL
jgi:hypothetical protein